MAQPSGQVRAVMAGRHLVENLRARVKEWRAVATRYEKTARSLLSVLCLAATADWLKLWRSLGWLASRKGR
jgi:hypothetical protein